MDEYEYDDDFEEEHTSEETSRKPSHLVKPSKDNKKTKHGKNRGHLQFTSPQGRIVSAKDKEIKKLHNKLMELTNCLQETTKENKLMKRQQVRYEKELQGISKQEGGLPDLLQKHKEEVRTIRVQLQRARLNNADLMKRSKDTSAELWKAQESVKKLNAIVKRKDLAEREQLVFQLQDMQERLNEKEEMRKKLEKSLELNRKMYEQEMKSLMARNKSQITKIEEMRDENRNIRWQLKEKERLLEVTNIYTQRIQQHDISLPSIPMTDDHGTQTTLTHPPMTEVILTVKPNLRPAECQTDSTWLNNLLSKGTANNEDQSNNASSISNALSGVAPPNTKYSTYFKNPLTNQLTNPSTSTNQLAQTTNQLTSPLTNQLVQSTNQTTNQLTSPLTNQLVQSTNQTTNQLTSPLTNQLVQSTIQSTNQTTNQLASPLTNQATIPTTSTGTSIFNDYQMKTAAVTTTNHAIPVSQFDSTLTTFTSTTPTPYKTAATPTRATPINDIIRTTSPLPKQDDIKALLSPKQPVAKQQATPTLSESGELNPQRKKELLDKLFPVTTATGINPTPTDRTNTATPTRPTFSDFFQTKLATEDQATPPSVTTPTAGDIQTKSDLLSKLFPKEDTTKPVAKETSSASLLSWPERIENMHHGLPAMTSTEDRHRKATGNHGNSRRDKEDNHSNKSERNSSKISLEGNKFGRRGGGTIEKQQAKTIPMFDGQQIFGNSTTDSNNITKLHLSGNYGGESNSRGKYPWEIKVDLKSSDSLGSPGGMTTSNNNIISGDDDLEELAI